MLRLPMLALLGLVLAGCCCHASAGPARTPHYARPYRHSTVHVHSSYVVTPRHSVAAPPVHRRAQPRIADRDDPRRHQRGRSRRR